MFKRSHTIQMDTITHDEHLPKAAHQATRRPLSREVRALCAMSRDTLLPLGSDSMRVPQHVRRNGPVWHGRYHSESTHSNACVSHKEPRRRSASRRQSNVAAPVPKPGEIPWD